MNQALRIFAHTAQRSSLARPPRTRSFVVARANDPPRALVAPEAPATGDAAAPDAAATTVAAPTITETTVVETACSDELAGVDGVEAVTREVAVPVVIVHEPTEPMLAPAIEQTILEVLSALPEFGETIEAAYRRKERTLAALFASLSRQEAALVHKRLADPHADDPLAARFARLVVERRTRLLAVLADVPRREARRRR